MADNRLRRLIAKRDLARVGLRRFHIGWVDRGSGAVRAEVQLHLLKMVEARSPRAGSFCQLVFPDMLSCLPKRNEVKRVIRREMLFLLAEFTINGLQAWKVTCR